MGLARRRSRILASRLYVGQQASWRTTEAAFEIKWEVVDGRERMRCRELGLKHSVLPESLLAYILPHPSPLNFHRTPNGYQMVPRSTLPVVVWPCSSGAQVVIAGRDGMNFLCALTHLGSGPAYGLQPATATQTIHDSAHHQANLITSLWVRMRPSLIIKLLAMTP